MNSYLDYYGCFRLTSITIPNSVIPLKVCEKLELLAKLAAGTASSVEDKTYSGVAAKKATISLASGRNLNVVAAVFVK